MANTGYGTPLMSLPEGYADEEERQQELRLRIAEREPEVQEEKKDTRSWMHKLVGRYAEGLLIQKGLGNQKQELKLRQQKHKLDEQMAELQKQQLMRQWTKEEAAKGFGEYFRQRDAQGAPTGDDGQGDASVGLPSQSPVQERTYAGPGSFGTGAITLAPTTQRTSSDDMISSMPMPLRNTIAEAYRTGHPEVAQSLISDYMKNRYGGERGTLERQKAEIDIAKGGQELEFGSAERVQKLRKGDVDIRKAEKEVAQIDYGLGKDLNPVVHELFGEQLKGGRQPTPEMVGVASAVFRERDVADRTKIAQQHQVEAANVKAQSEKENQPLSGPAVETYAAYNGAIRMVNDIGKLVQSNYVGRIEGITGDAYEFAGLLGDKEKTFRTTLRQFKLFFQKALSGAQMTEQEAKRISKALPSQYESDEQFLSALRVAGKILEETRDDRLKAMTTSRGELLKTAPRVSIPEPASGKPKGKVATPSKAPLKDIDKMSLEEVEREIAEREKRKR